MNPLIEGIQTLFVSLSLDWVQAPNLYWFGWSILPRPCEGRLLFYRSRLHSFCKILLSYIFVRLSFLLLFEKPTLKGRLFDIFFRFVNVTTKVTFVNIVGHYIAAFFANSLKSGCLWWQLSLEEFFLGRFVRYSL